MCGVVGDCGRDVIYWYMHGGECIVSVCVVIMDVRLILCTGVKLCAWCMVILKVMRYIGICIVVIACTECVYCDCGGGVGLYYYMHCGDGFIGICTNNTQPLCHNLSIIISALWLHLRHCFPSIG